MACTRLLILIISAPDERERRATIRSTWAHDLRLRQSEAARVFVVNARSRSEQRLLEAERLEFDDILMDGRVVEEYNGMTQKVISALHWASMQPSQQLRYVAKIDSDNFVHVGFLSRIADKVWTAHGSLWMAGYQKDIKRSLRPIRDKNYKWHVSAKEYPFHFFPTYLHGPHYIMTLEAARKATGNETLKEIASGLALRKEDVYVTGIVRSRLRIPIYSINQFFRPYSRHVFDFVEGIPTWLFAAIHSIRRNVDFVRLQEWSDEPHLRFTFLTAMTKRSDLSKVRVLSLDRYSHIDYSL